MPNLRLIYIAGFNIDRNTGRNNATRDKTDALRALLEPGRFSFYFPSASPSKLLSYLQLLLFDFRMLFRLATLDQGAVVIQRQTFLPLTNTMLRARKIRMTYELHTDLQDELPHLGKGPLDRILNRALIRAERHNLRNCQAIIFNNPVLQKAVVARYLKPSVSIYNGVNPAVFFPMNKLDCRRQLGLDERATYFLFSGMVSKWHGVEYLVNIFKEGVIASRSDIHLLIVGTTGNAYSKALRGLAAGYPNIRFVDLVPREKLPLYINAADLCLLPVNNIRTSPGSPLKLYEYAACGKPVITQEGVEGYADEVLKYNFGKVTNFESFGPASEFLLNFIDDLKSSRLIAKDLEEITSAISWKSRMMEWCIFFERAP